MTTSRASTASGVRTPGRRLGYIMAAGINAASIYLVGNLLEWEFLPFLTAEFEELLPIVTVSLLASVAVNLFYLWDDARHIKSTGQILTGLVALVVAVRTWVIFPFNFSPYEFDWNVVARVALVLSMIGAIIGVLVESVRLAKAVIALD